VLIPRRLKHRKQHHPGRSGAATGGTAISFGEFGIQALEPAYVTTPARPDAAQRLRELAALRPELSVLLNGPLPGPAHFS
jgi:hypothetical protein